MAKSSKSKQQDQQTSKLQVEVRYAKDSMAERCQRTSCLTMARSTKVTKIHSVKLPSPFLDNPNTRCKVSVSVDGSSEYVEAV